MTPPHTPRWRRTTRRSGCPRTSPWCRSWPAAAAHTRRQDRSRRSRRHKSPGGRAGCTAHIGRRKSIRNTRRLRNSRTRIVWRCCTPRRQEARCRHLSCWGQRRNRSPKTCLTHRRWKQPNWPPWTRWMFRPWTHWMWPRWTSRMFRPWTHWTWRRWTRWKLRPWTFRTLRLQMYRMLHPPTLLRCRRPWKHRTLHPWTRWTLRLTLPRWRPWKHRTFRPWMQWRSRPWKSPRTFRPPRSQPGMKTSPVTHRWPRHWTHRHRTTRNRYPLEAGHWTACMQPSTPTPPAPAEQCALVPTPASRLPRGNRAGG
jgi:hypothetical protein